MKRLHLVGLEKLIKASPKNNCGQFQKTLFLEVATVHHNLIRCTILRPFGISSKHITSSISEIFLNYFCATNLVIFLGEGYLFME